MTIRYFLLYSKNSNNVHFIKKLLFFLFLIIFLSGHSKIANAIEKDTELIISAASSLKNVLEEITIEFRKINNNIKLILNFAASGKLRVQIEHAAPVDIFIPASVIDIKKLEKSNLIFKDTLNNLAKNELVLISNSKNKSIKNLLDLCEKHIKRIAIGNINTVPAGKYAKEVFDSYGIFSNIKQKLIFTESAKQTLYYVSRNNVDCGLVFFTDAKTDKNVKIINVIPSKMHSPILYQMVIIKSTKHLREANNFLKFLKSKQVKKILIKNGFII